MSLQIEGTYENGRITLASPPKGVRKAKVVVTFVGKQTTPKPVTRKPKKKPSRSKMMYFGMFSGPIKTNDADFRSVEWHGDEEDLRG